MLSWGFYGALVVQVCKYDYVNYTTQTATHPSLVDLYYLAFPKDRRWMKILVWGVALIETIQTAFMSHDAVMALGLGFGDRAALDSVHFDWLTLPLITAIGEHFNLIFYVVR